MSCQVRTEYLHIIWKKFGFQGVNSLAYLTAERWRPSRLALTAYVYVYEMLLDVSDAVRRGHLLLHFYINFTQEVWVDKMKQYMPKL